MTRQLPPEFISRMATDRMADVTDALASTAPSISIRINRAKGGTAPSGARSVAWNEDGFYLASRPAFTLDPALHQGLYYVQDASSMAIRKAVERATEAVVPNGPLRYLDACAAPGGKTTAALDSLPDDAFVVANEPDSRRAAVLAENVAKWGCPAIITREDASRIKGMDGFFDIIAADMPCSGEGMMRKEPAAVEQWSPALVAECAARQADIARCLWESLAPGGVLIYSTCTFNTAENEEIIAALINDFGAEPLPIEALDKIDDICGAVGGFDFPAYRFLPGRTDGEGLFMAMLRKPADTARRDRLKPAKIKTIPAPGPLLGGDMAFFEHNSTLRAIPSAHLPLAAHVVKAMNVAAAGIEAGEMKGRDFVPAQPLALARDLNLSAFPLHEVDLDTALAYLRREAVALQDAPRGFVLLTFGGKPLGFVKNLGNRANNLYPMAWRIRNAAKP